MGCNLYGGWFGNQIIIIQSASVPDKRQVSGQNPDGNRYLTQHWRKWQLAKVLS